MEKDPDIGGSSYNGPLPMSDVYCPCPHGTNPSNCWACAREKIENLESEIADLHRQAVEMGGEILGLEAEKAALKEEEYQHQANELLLAGIRMTLEEQTGEEQEETIRTMVGMGPKDKEATITQLGERDKVWDDLRTLIGDDAKFDAVQKLIKFHWEGF